MKIVALLLSFISMSLSAETIYEVKGFSDKYFAKIIINDDSSNDYFTEGQIAIFDADTNDEIVSVMSQALSFSFDESIDLTSGVKGLYDEQNGSIISQDFNFDGKKDIARMAGRLSCYGGPSFQVYLELNNTLKHSPEFTRLAQEYCGMFSVDEKTKTISTATKSGCCWHQFSDFKIENNIPVAIKIIERRVGAEGITLNYVEKTRVGNELIEKKYSSLLENVDLTELYSATFKNDKKMTLYSAFDEENLLYIFADKDEKIELMYYEEFTLDAMKKTLSFNYRNTKYQVHSDGIKISLPSKNINISAIQTKGNLSDLSLLSVNNLTVK